MAGERHPSDDAENPGSGGEIPFLAAKEASRSPSRSREGSHDRIPASPVVRCHLQADGGVDVRVQGVLRPREGTRPYRHEQEEPEQAVVHHLEKVPQVRRRLARDEEAGGVRGHRRLLRKEERLEGDPVRRPRELGLGEGARGDRGGLLLRSLIRANGIRGAREPEVRGGVKRSSEERRTTAESGRLLLLWGEMPSGG